MPALFDPAFQFLLPHEGGFQKLVNDPGNWTGGRSGVGELRGTKFGISAASYPTLDIENLTLAEVEAIYRRDYWEFVGLGVIDDQQIASKVFDYCVWSGKVGGVMLLQRALNTAGTTPSLPITGHFGPLTTAAVNAKPAGLMNDLCQAQMAHCESLIEENPKLSQFREGWLERANEVPQAQVVT